MDPYLELRAGDMLVGSRRFGNHHVRCPIEDHDRQRRLATDRALEPWAQDVLTRLERFDDRLERCPTLDHDH